MLLQAGVKRQKVVLDYLARHQKEIFYPVSALCPAAIAGQKAQFYVFDGKKVKGSAQPSSGQNIEVVGEQLLFDDNIECDKQFEEDGVVNLIGARIP